MPHFPVPTNALPTGMNVPATQPVVTQAPVANTQVAQSTLSVAAQTTTPAATTTSNAESKMAGLWMLVAFIL